MVESESGTVKVNSDTMVESEMGTMVINDSSTDTEDEPDDATMKSRSFCYNKVHQILELPSIHYHLLHCT